MRLATFASILGFLLLATVPLGPAARASASAARTSIHLLPASGAGGDSPASGGEVRSTEGDLCTPQIFTHTNFDFVGGSFVTQAGFQESEIAAASYVLPADAFPVRVDVLEMVFAQNNATVTTTTQWSTLVWRGVPSTGTLLATFTSGSVGIPHLVLPPGTIGAILRVSIDPGAPLVVTDDGSHTFSIGYRIDDHNDEPADPCTGTPPSNSNAFPTTDVSGVQNPTGNWLFGVNCGVFSCPANGGWARFSQLPQFCRPSGDWVLRATVRTGFAANEVPNLTCSDGLDNDCDGRMDCDDSDCDTDGVCLAVALDRQPDGAELNLAVTNPFASEAEFRLRMPVAAQARLELFDVAGRFVVRILDRRLEAGLHRATWDGRLPGRAGVPPGVYFVRLTTERQVAVVRKLVVVR
jgi:hypothetical protein